MSWTRTAGSSIDALAGFTGGPKALGTGTDLVDLTAAIVSGTLFPLSFTTVTMTASTSGCTNPVYRFWARRQGGHWDIEQDYSTSNTWSWATPLTGAAGMFEFEVDVRDQAETVAYDAVKNITYTLAGCSAAGRPAAGRSPT